MALEMQKEILDSIEDFVATQKQREENTGDGVQKTDATVLTPAAGKSRPGRERRSLLTATGELKDSSSDLASRRKSRTSSDSADPNQAPNQTGAKTRKSFQRTK